MRASLWILAGVMIVAVTLTGCRRDNPKSDQGTGAGGTDVSSSETGENGGAAVSPSKGPRKRPAKSTVNASGQAISQGEARVPPGTARGTPKEGSPDGTPPEEPDPSDEVRKLVTQGDTAGVLRTLDDHPEWTKSTDTDGRTLLHLAALAGKKEMVAALAGMPEFDLQAKDAEGNTSLALASREGHAGIVTLLLDKGADLTATNAQGYTALDQATSLDRSDVVKLLAGRGGDVNHVIANGQTPLHVAAFGGHLEMAKTLLESGADINAKDSQGRTALSIAEMLGNVGLAKLLKDAGATSSR